MVRKKRTITPEHLAKMQEGKRRKKVYRERVGQASALEHRVFYERDDSMYPTTRKAQRRYHKKG